MRVQTKIKYALLAVEKRSDLINPVHQNCYGEGVLAGIDIGIKYRKKKGESKDEANVKTTAVRRKTRLE